LVGWRISRADSGLKLQCDWNLKEFQSKLGAFAKGIIPRPVVKDNPENKCT